MTDATPPIARVSAAEALVRSLSRLRLVQRAIARHTHAELGSQGLAALALVHRDGSVRVGDVAQHLSVDGSVASRQVAALAAAGYLRREPDPEDGRAHRISLTEEGVRVLAVSHERMVAAFADALAGWPEDDVLALAKGLDRLREDFARALSAPRSPGPPAAA